MFDMRAYVASLIAVFLALAIGILVGTMVQERAPLVDEIDAQIKNLKQEFKAVREENKQLSRQVEIDKRFAEKVAPILTEGKLVGESLLVISTGRPSKKVVGETVQALEKAGAEVTQIDLLKFTLDASLREELGGLLPAGARGATEDAGSSREADRAGDSKTPDAGGDQPVLAALLAAAVADTKAKPGLTDLAGAKAVKLNGPLPSKLTGAVLVVDPRKDLGIEKSLLIPFVTSLSDAKFTLVAVESGVAGESLMPALASAGASTVDNVDDAVGAISVVFAVAGERGAFGKKDPTAEAVPDLR